MVKKKGVKDRFELNVNDTEAEINPVLSYYLKDLYGIELPDFIDLETSSIEELVQSIKNQISLGGTGIDLRWRDKPKIQLIHKLAKRNFKLKKRKLSNRNSGLSTRSYDYSYDAQNVKPLGLLFSITLLPKSITSSSISLMRISTHIVILLLQSAAAVFIIPIMMEM